MGTKRNIEDDETGSYTKAKAVTWCDVMNRWEQVVGMVTGRNR